MIKGGYILQPRIIQESDISVAPPYVREIWNFLLREANSEDAIYSGKIIKRGQLFRTYDDIREGTKWFIGWRKMAYNENQTKKAMKFLRDTQRISTRKELGGVLITICKYEFYQNPNNYKKTNERTYERTIEEPTKNHPIPDNNNNQEESINNQKEIKNILLSQVDESTLDQTEKKYYQIAISFWELFKFNMTELDISTKTLDEAKYELWVKPIRLLMTNDKRNIEEIREVFSFLKDDRFWKEQIRSTEKLRKKNNDGITYFETLLIKSRNEHKRKQQSSGGGSQSNVSEDYKKSILNRLLYSQNSETM